MSPQNLKSGSWQFDSHVAVSFEPHARANIPGYESVVGWCARIAEKLLPPGAPIVEIGCATGFTLRALEQAGFTDLTGIDNSQSMLDRCVVQHSRLICSDVFPAELGPFKLALLNWTLHFVKPEARRAYLADVCKALAPDGLLVLTEKTRQSAFVESLYHDWKASQGMSAEDIAAKKASLVGVLEPLPHRWYVDTLEALGFTTEVISARLGFVTYLAYRPGTL